MILNLLKFLTPDNNSLTEAADRLMVMSDYEYVELAYILRKILRECDYDTEKNVVMFRGFEVIYSDDYEIFLTFSKLFSKQPYESVYNVADKFKGVIK